MLPSITGPVATPAYPAMADMVAFSSALKSFAPLLLFFDSFLGYAH
jgi:hypothetical protein